MISHIPLPSAPSKKLGRWTPALLSDFLSDPFKFASGAAVPPPGKIRPEDIKEIVDVLVRASDHADKPVQTSKYTLTH
jgi:cytochrome c2